MKTKILIALILNSILFLISCNIFFKKNFGETIDTWRFWASLTSVLIFGFFVFMLVKRLIR